MESARSKTRDPISRLRASREDEYSRSHVGFCCSTPPRNLRIERAQTDPRYLVRKKPVKKEEERAAVGDAREIESRISFGGDAERRTAKNRRSRLH